MRRELIEMDHQQPPTPIQIGNTAANSFLNGTLKQKGTKITDVKHYWIQYCNQQDHFRLFWKPGKQNLVDPFTKNHSPAEHLIFRKIFKK